MKKILLFLLPVSLLFTSCDLFNNYGKKVSINDKNEVYYKGDDVTENNAKDLGNYLEKTGFFNPQKEETAQVLKNKNDDKYTVKFVYDKDYFNKNSDQLNVIFWLLQDQISQNVFNGKKVSIALTDNKLNNFQTFDDVNKVSIGNDDVYYKSPVKEQDAKSIGDSLSVSKFLDYTNGSIILGKDKGTYTISFIPNADMQKAKGDAFPTILENYKYIISKYVLNGGDVDLYVLDNEYNIAQKVKEPSDDRKAQIDQMINGQQTTTQQDQTQ